MRLVVGGGTLVIEYVCRIFDFLDQKMSGRGLQDCCPRPERLLSKCGPTILGRTGGEIYSMRGISKKRTQDHHTYHHNYIHTHLIMMHRLC